MNEITITGTNWREHVQEQAVLGAPYRAAPLLRAVRSEGGGVLVAVLVPVSPQGNGVPEPELAHRRLGVADPQEVEQV